MALVCIIYARSSNHGKSTTSHRAISAEMARCEVVLTASWARDHVLTTRYLYFLYDWDDLSSK